jgi:hypothetical protein
MKELEPKQAQNNLPIIDDEITSKLFTINAPFAEPLDYHYSPLIDIMYVGKSFSGFLNEVKGDCSKYGLSFAPCLVGMRAAIEPFLIKQENFIRQLRRISSDQREFAVGVARECLFRGGPVNLKEIPNEQSHLRSYIKVVEMNNENIEKDNKVDKRSFCRGAVAGYKYMEQIFSNFR